MKRAVGAVVAGLMVLGGLPAAARPPSAGAAAEQNAFAAWVRWRGDSGTMTAASGWRFVYEGRLRSLGGVTRGSCKRVRTGGWIIQRCSASGRMKEVGLEGFQMDPALRRASLALRSQGQEHRVEWSGGDPSVGQGMGAGPWGLVGGVGADADARAKGRVFGQKVRKGCWLCFMGESAGAGVLTGARGSLIPVGRDHTLRLSIHGDRYRLRLTRKTRA